MLLACSVGAGLPGLWFCCTSISCIPLQSELWHWVCLLNESLVMTRNALLTLPGGSTQGHGKTWLWASIPRVVEKRNPAQGLTACRTLGKSHEAARSFAGSSLSFSNAINAIFRPLITSYPFLLHCTARCCCCMICHVAVSCHLKLVHFLVSMQCKLT
jgi:hypothetical protein